ncbi:hypothetical protein SLA2020_093210 [Shorea laevis]
MNKQADDIDEVESFLNAGSGCDKLLFPSANYNNIVEARSYEDACRSFENYLVEMIVEEGNVSDLMDVEELLYCWKNLRCPVFIDLVSRFYGELCRDLFSTNDEVECENVGKN